MASQNDGAGQEESSQKSTAKVAAVKPEYITVQKDQYELIEKISRKMKSELKAGENLKHINQDSLEKLKKEEGKSKRFQAALIAAEARIGDFIRAQLDAPIREKVDKVTETSNSTVLFPLQNIYETESQKHIKFNASRTVPIQLDDANLQSRDSGYNSCGSNTTSFQSFLSRESDSMASKSKAAEMTNSEYEEIIQKLNVKIKKQELSHQHLKQLLEAKKMNNVDALTSQLTAALQKVEDLDKSNRNKDVVIQNYYRAYMQLAKQKTEDPNSFATQSEEQPCDQQMRLLEKDKHIMAICEKLRVAVGIIEDLKKTRHTISDTPMTNMELRDDVLQLQNEIGHLKKFIGKLQLERDGLNAQVKILRSQQSPSSTMQQANMEKLQHQMLQLLDALKAKDAELKKQVELFQHHKQTIASLRQHSKQQEQLIVSLQSTMPSRTPLNKQSTPSHSKSDLVHDDDVLTCDRCLKEYSIEDVEKYQKHCEKCVDE